MMHTGSKTIRRLRVLSVPGRRHAQNSHFPLLWDALQAVGVQMISARTTATLTLRYDIFHVHLPEVLVEKPIHLALIGGPLFLAYVATSRVAGKKLVWTIHEVTPTRPHLLTQPFLWCLRKLANAYVFMNRTSEEEFFKRYPDERRKIIWRILHSAYPVTKISPARRSDVRVSLALGPDCLAVGFLGEIRPYKNPSALQYLPMTDPQGRPVILVIAGAYHASCDIDDMEAKFRTIAPRQLVQMESDPPTKDCRNLFNP